MRKSTTSCIGNSEQNMNLSHIYLAAFSKELSKSMADNFSTWCKKLANSDFLLMGPNWNFWEFVCLYSSNKIRKTQNEHLNCEHHLSKFELPVVVNLKQFYFLFFWCLYHLLFDLETIGIGYIIIWWLIFETKPNQFWQEIWIQVLDILLQLYFWEKKVFELGYDTRDN
jgi:hypothetical protein